jgi:hypothetical protein
MGILRTKTEGDRTSLMGYTLLLFFCIYIGSTAKLGKKKWTRYRVQNIIYILKRGSWDKFNPRLLEFDNRYISFV